LLHDLAAVPLFIQHTLHTAHLSFDASKALDKLLLGFLILDFHSILSGYIADAGKSCFNGSDIGWKTQRLLVPIRVK
jgi:hypothetical protein